MKSAHQVHRLVTAVLGVALAGLLVGCGSSDSSSTAAETTPTPSATSTTPAGCADVAALKSSMQTLAEIRPLQDGLEATKAAAADAKAALDTAVAAIGAELQPAVEEIKTAFESVQTAVDDLTTDNIRDQAPVIATALQGLGTAVTALTSTMSQDCP